MQSASITQAVSSPSLQVIFRPQLHHEASIINPVLISNYFSILIGRVVAHVPSCSLCNHGHEHHLLGQIDFKKLHYLLVYFSFSPGELV